MVLNGRIIPDSGNLVHLNIEWLTPRLNLSNLHTSTLLSMLILLLATISFPASSDVLISKSYSFVRLHFPCAIISDVTNKILIY